MSCIFAFYLAGAGAGIAQAGQSATLPKAADWAQTSTLDPDELYKQREDVNKAKQAAEIWLARAGSGKSYEASWKLARASYYLGTHGPKDEQAAALERGITAGRQAAALEPNKTEGHFWYAANMGEKAQRSSKFTALGLKGDIKSELEKSIAIQPGWQAGSAESALGEWYIRVPDNFLCCGGDHKKGIELLRKALSFDPTNKQTKVTLADALADDDKTRAEAKQLLQQVIDEPIDPNWAAEDRGFQAKARDMLAKLNGKG